MVWVLESLTEILVTMIPRFTVEQSVEKDDDVMASDRLLS